MLAFFSSIWLITGYNGHLSQLPGGDRSRLIKVSEGHYLHIQEYCIVGITVVAICGYSVLFFYQGHAGIPDPEIAGVLESNL